MNLINWLSYVYLLLLSFILMSKYWVEQHLKGSWYNFAAKTSSKTLLWCCAYTNDLCVMRFIVITMNVFLKYIKHPIFHCLFHIHMQKHFIVDLVFLSWKFILYLYKYIFQYIKNYHVEFITMTHFNIFPILFYYSHKYIHTHTD